MEAEIYLCTPEDMSDMCIEAVNICTHGRMELGIR